MNENKKNIELHNGWILCPSKSFPGKFYYFNVLNGEAAWSLNQADNKGVKKESSIHKIADKSHEYPEPTTLPDESTVPSHNICTNVEKPDFVQIPSAPSHQQPTFGQATFPKYVANVEPAFPNIIWTSVPFPMLCPESKKPMFDKVTQISEFEREFFSQSTNTPLCKRFKNYEKPFLSFDRRNKLVKPVAKFETSTPKNSFLECASESQNCFPKPFIKQPTFKFEPKLPQPKTPDVVTSKEKPIISFSNKVESTKPGTDVSKVVQENNVLENLERTDLRFLLLAKRKSVDATADSAVERKKLKTTELTPLTPKKKVSFNLKDEPDEDLHLSMAHDYTPLTSNHSATTIDCLNSSLSLKDDNTQPFIKESYLDTSKESVPFVNTCVPTFKKKTWYIVVDTDVLLLDYELIDKVVLSDPKCKLVIPHAVAADIEALCLGDCRGQQRVINARQLTRKLATPPPHYIVEPRTLDNGNIVVTTDCILQCCLKAVTKSYYVVLITNDPHLQIRARLLNIPSYKLNDIKYGVNIKPDITSEPTSIETNALSNNFTDTKNQYNQNLRLLSNLNIKPDLKIDEKSMKINIPSTIVEKNEYNQNFSLFNFKNPVKKLFLSSDSDTDGGAECDNLKLNITKPKCLKNNDYNSKCDSDVTSDISSEVFSLKIKDDNVLKTPNVARNPYLPPNVKENGFVDFQKRILNPNTIFNKYSFEKTIPNENPEPVNQVLDFQKDYLDNNFENTGKVFTSMPITKMTKLDNSGQLEMPTTCLALRQEPFGTCRDNKLLNPSQTRIKQMINTINSDSTTTPCLNNQITNTKDSTGLFKIPQLIPIKNGTRNTSVYVENSNVNDKIGARATIDSIDESLKRFRVKSKSMREKIKARFDEWICSYMQIMEDALIHVLQENSVCMENTIAPLTLKDTLNCIKMLYGNNTKIRDITDKISELLDKCMICVQGKFKISLIPEDFMKILGCGLLLVLNLKNTLPQNEALREAELRLNSLQNTIENNTKEIDPEVVKSPSISRTEKDEEVRPQFIKKKSYVIDYLKKHFKEWASYTEDVEDQNRKLQNHSDFKVVRTLGKNLNLLKIDRSKTLSLSKNTKENNLTNKSNNGPKIIRLLQNNQINKPRPEIQTRLNLMDEKDSFLEENEILPDHERPLQKLNENAEKDQKTESKVSEGFNFTTHENTFFGSSEKDGPKLIRNMKLIDEYEKKILKEPLDLDLLDYSEIYEPSVNENPEFDIISEKNNHSKKNEDSENNNENFGLTENNFMTLEDFYLSPSICDSKNNDKTKDSKNIEGSSTNIKDDSSSEHITSYYFNSENNDNKKSFPHKINNSEVESETYTEKMESRNDSCIDNDNSESHLDNSEILLDNSENRLENSVTHLGNSETGQIVLDESTTDSGFENDSTYAHSLVKIFLNELSTSFKVIYTFVTNFVEEICGKKLSKARRDVLHNQASKSLEDMVAIIQRLRRIIKRESAEDTVLKTLLRNAGVEATTDKRMTRYRQIVIKSLEQAIILENALKIIVSITIGDFEALSTNAETIHSSIRYFNIFE